MSQVDTKLSSNIVLKEMSELDDPSSADMFYIPMSGLLSSLATPIDLELENAR
jgi:hypothetical protein